MAARRLLVDTNVVIDFFAGDPSLVQLITDAEPVCVPVIVIGELLAGARRSQRVEHNLRRIETFVGRSELLECDRGTADHYAEIENQLRIRGRPIPENDMWIAAVARQHGLALATRDTHFDHVHSVVKVPC